MQVHGDGCIKREVPAETSPDAEHICGGWHGRGSYSRWTPQENATLYHPLQQKRGEHRYKRSQDLSCSSTTHPRRYWKKIFLSLLDMTLLNTYEVQCSNTDAVQCKTRHYFLCSVLQNLCGVNSAGQGVAAAEPVNLPTDHELQHLPGQQEQDCVVCSDRARGKQKQSSFWCLACGTVVHKHCFSNLVQQLVYMYENHKFKK